ncbi:MAG: hypothetical protein C5B52_10870 [Bacteroidetes bacterium]|nr:MAG: hypothetical protein C5B52_10870 [Bacteroidota bacterium]
MNGSLIVTQKIEMKLQVGYSGDRHLYNRKLRFMPSTNQNHNNKPTIAISGTQIKGKDQFYADIKSQIGVVPDFFKLPQNKPETPDALWGFAVSAYLDNPLPPLFKERLFVYLSRFCEAKYSITRHLGFLIGLGHAAGESSIPPQSIKEVMTLLERNLHRDQNMATINKVLLDMPALANLPQEETELEDAIFACTTHVFLQTEEAANCLNVLKHVLDDSTFQYLLVFLAFVRTAHYWSILQQNLRVGDEIEELLAIHEKLAELLFKDDEAYSYQINNALLTELESLRMEKLAHEMVGHEERVVREKQEALISKTTFELNARVKQLEGANEEIRNARRAALNLMEDAVLAEENIKMLEERYRVALDSANMGTWDWNMDKDVIVWNEEHYHLLGLPADSSARNLDFFFQFVHENDLDLLRMVLQKAILETGYYQMEFRIERADNGQMRWMTSFGRVVARNGGRATRMVGVMFDITERKKLEQQKDDFIGIASHELRTPVTSIKAYTEILQELCEEDSYTQGTELLKKLDMQVDRLAHLVRSLLDTTKISEGQLSFAYQEFDLTKLINERVDDLRPTSEEHNLVFKTKDKLSVFADKERIGQVLINLISNAIKYSPKGSDIVINAIRTDEGIEVSVKDYGTGIPSEIKEKIFERFYRARSSQTDVFPGIGLGLYIAAEIMKRHGGRIWVESEQNKGSVFYFLLPNQNGL